VNLPVEGAGDHGAADRVERGGILDCPLGWELPDEPPRAGVGEDEVAVVGADGHGLPGRTIERRAVQVLAYGELPDLRPRAHVKGGEAPPPARHLVLESKEEEIEGGRQRGRGTHPVGARESAVLADFPGVETA